MSIPLENFLIALHQRAIAVAHLCTQCNSPHLDLYFYPQLNHAWLCAKCNQRLLQRQKDAPNLPLFLVRRNAVKRLSDTSFLERWLICLASNEPLSDEQLLNVASLLGLQWWADAAPGAVFRGHPSFRQSHHWLIISQICGLNV